MKIKLLIMSLLVLGSLNSMAQHPNGEDGMRPPHGQMGPPGRGADGERPSMDRLRAMKVGMITNELSLTSKQAKGFWPIYDAYDSERRTLHSILRKQMKNSKKGKLSEKEEIKLQDEIFELKQKELELDRDYRPKFLKVISASQYSDLLTAEKEFNQMLLKELRERRNRE